MIFISSFRRINMGEERIGKSQLIELSCVLGLIEKELREKGKKNEDLRVYGNSLEEQEVGFKEEILDLKITNKGNKMLFGNNCYVP